MRAKTRNNIHMAGVSKREPPLHFGDLVTCDHKYYSDPWKFPGVGGYWYSLNILDHATRYRMSIAVRRLTAEKTAAAIRFFQGDQKIRLMYADGAGSIVKACRIERINLEESQPGVPQSNGVIERANGYIG